MVIYDLDAETRYSILFAIHQALLGYITDEVLVVVINVDDSIIKLQILTSSELSQKDKDDFCFAAKNAQSKITQPFSIQVFFIVEPVPKPISSESFVLFRSKEASFIQSDDSPHD